MRTTLLAAFLLPVAANAAERPTLEAFIPVIERAQPLGIELANKLFGEGRLACDAGNCEARDVALEDISIGRVDFRYREAGSILILDGFSGPCLPARRLMSEYPGGATETGCTDGAVCNTYSVARPWGTLSFGLPADLDAPLQCVTSVIFNTFEATR